MRFLITAVVLVAFGGCSQKVTLEDVDNLKHNETTPSDVKSLFGEPDRELAFGTTPDYDTHLMVYVIGWEEILLIFRKKPELTESDDFVLTTKQKFPTKKKKLLAEDYLKKFGKPIPPAWQP